MSRACVFYVTLKIVALYSEGINIRSALCLLTRSQIQCMYDFHSLASGFGGLVVSVRVRTRPKPLDFLGKKIHSMSSFGGEVKPPVPCHRFVACKRALWFMWESESQAKLTGHFSPIILSFTNIGLVMSLDLERLWRWWAELKVVHNGPAAYGPRCDRVVAP
jgi:hypothetical protein